MSDSGEPIPGAAPMEAMGMTKPKEKLPEEPKVIQEAKPLTEAAQMEPSGTSVEDLFKAGNIDSLLQAKDSPDAQLAAMVLLSNQYKHFNVRNEGCIGWLGSVDIETVSQTLGLDEADREMLQSKRTAIADTFSKFRSVYKERDEISEQAKYSWGDSQKEYQEQAQALVAQEMQLEAVMEIAYRELMLPIREAVLASDQLPEQFKLSVVEGIKGYGSVLEGEDELLKQHYPSADEAIKRQIADTVMFNMGHDLNSFDVVPVGDLQEQGVDIEKMFIATLGNRKMTADFVEQRVAPAFFPDTDPAKVRQSWDTLRKVTGLENQEGTSFASDGYNHHTKVMNTEFFRNFMENSEELTPVVSLLSEYGFKYVPATILDGKFNPEYVTRLKELGKNLDELKSELEAIKSVVPDYRYRFAVDTRYPETKDGQETYIEDNPFSIALKQKIYPYGLETNDKFNQTTQLFESLHKVVPERWRAGFTATYVDMMSMTAIYKDRPQGITSRAIGEASKYAFDASLTPEDVELFATKFFEASLDPRNENVRAVFEFCDRYADKIRTWGDGGKKVDADSTWYKFSLLASDVYRYPITAGKEDEAVNKAKGDLTYAIGAISRISNPATRDKAISNLVYGLTDEEIGDLKTAQSFVEMMDDENLKKDAQEEIQLEIERANKGESTTWKKMEKVRRASAANAKFIEDLFGYGSAEALQTAQTQYRERTKMSPDYYATYSDERKAQLGQEIERIRENFQVTLNITWANVLKTLESGRAISIWENPEVMEYRNTTGKYHYETRRDEIERLVGNRAKGGMRDPHPVYAAGASPNGRDELYGGTGGGYGETFLVLKTDRIKDRTSFCYDDSFDGYHDWMLDWDGGVTAKAIHNLNGSNSRHGYVEAQVLGGITLEDIESINVPSDAIYGENKYGWSVGTNVLPQIEELRQKYPGIKINIIEVPKQQT